MVPYYLTVHSVKVDGAWGQEACCPPPTYSAGRVLLGSHRECLFSGALKKSVGRAGVGRTCLLRGPFCACVQSQGISCHACIGDALC